MSIKAVDVNGLDIGMLNELWQTDCGKWLYERISKKGKSYYLLVCNRIPPRGPITLINNPYGDLRLSCSTVYLSASYVDSNIMKKMMGLMAKAEEDKDEISRLTKENEDLKKEVALLQAYKNHVEAYPF